MQDTYITYAMVNQNGDLQGCDYNSGGHPYSTVGMNDTFFGSLERITKWCNTCNGKEGRGYKVVRLIIKVEVV